MAKSWSEDHNNNFDKLEFTLYMYEVAVKKLQLFNKIVLEMMKIRFQQVILKGIITLL